MKENTVIEELSKLNFENCNNKNSQVIDEISIRCDGNQRKFALVFSKAINFMYVVINTEGSNLDQNVYLLDRIIELFIPKRKVKIDKSLFNNDGDFLIEKKEGDQELIIKKIKNQTVISFYKEGE